MEKISSKQLRERWNDFRLSKQHIYLPESSLVGGKESTAMFTIAGMQQLIPYLSGKEHQLGKRLFNIQKCIRTVDIDEVGDSSHCTFFEMMGNRSLGDYFKKESVQRSREFLVNELGFDPKKLAVTVFEGDKDAPRDNETAGYWQEIGMPVDKIAYMGSDNNRWSPGPIGPCGPDTEIFYRVGDSEFPPQSSNPKTDENNRLEIRNNVFMEYYRSKRVILTDAGACLYDDAGKIKDFDLLADLESWVNAGGKVIMVSNNPDVASFERVSFAMDIFTLSNNPSKKDIKYFEILFQKYNIVADDVVYFDHKQEHVDAAQKAGIKLITLYSDYQSIKSFIEENKYKLIKLDQHNVDTGMGFERMSKVLQEKKTVFDTDIFAPLLGLIETTLGMPYKGNERRCRIVADHIRTSFFLIAHDIIPSNEGRGYVLRRLIRRMYYNFMLLKPVTETMFDTFIVNIVGLVNDLMETNANTKNISMVLIRETHQFQKTITHGQKLLDELIKGANKKHISGKDIFKLYDTFGFPLELTKEILQEYGLSVDVEGFEQEMEAQQARSRAGSKDMFKQGTDWASYLQGIPPTKFVGYTTLELDTMHVLKDFDIQGQRILVFDTTPFYAESGGQIGDRGVVILDDGVQVSIVQVQKYNGIFLHFVE